MYHRHPPRTRQSPPLALWARAPRSTRLGPSASARRPSARRPSTRVPVRDYDEPFEALGNMWPTHPLCTLHSVHFPTFPTLPIPLFPIPCSLIPLLPTPLLLPYSPRPHSPTRRSPPPSAQRAPRRAPSASLYHRVHALSSHLRPQNHENTVSRPICEVKHGIV